MLGAGKDITRTMFLKENSVRNVVHGFMCRRLGAGNPAWGQF